MVLVKNLLILLDAAFKQIALNMWPGFCGCLLEEWLPLQVCPWEMAVSRQTLPLLSPTLGQVPGALGHPMCSSRAPPWAAKAHLAVPSSPRSSQSTKLWKRRFDHWRFKKNKPHLPNITF